LIFLKDIPVFSNLILPVLDILLLAYLLFKVYDILEETRAIQLLRGAVILALVYALAWFFQLSTLLWILEKIAPGLFIGVAIVFQPELRSIFARIGQRELFRRKTRQEPLHVEAVINAAEVLAGEKRGAMIVFSREVGLKNVIEMGVAINAEPSSALIISIFGFDGPLHDGAVVIQKGRLVAAGCWLPLSSQSDISRSFGTRHRAALGLAEETDAIVLIVSEETGALSLAYDGSIFYDISSEEIKLRLHELLGIRSGNLNEGGPF